MFAYPAKDIIYDEEARSKLAAGSDKLARAVVATLGPRSRNAAINMPWPAPTILHDGVSIARQVRLKDPFEDMGATLVREAATKTNELAGDGTTTATLLANTLVQQGMLLIKSGVASDGVIRGSINPMVLRDELLAASGRIVARLDLMARAITSFEETVSIASISASSEEIGNLVAEAVKKVGKDGIILVEESETNETTIQIQEGMSFDNGWLSRGFVTDPARMIAEYKDAYILLTDRRIGDANELVPIIEKVQLDGSKPLLIVAEDVVGAALDALVATRIKLSQPLIAVVAPEFGERRREALEDIAILTGAVVLTSDTGKKLIDAEISDLGRLRNLFVSQHHTEFTPAYPDAEEIAERIQDIRTQMAEEENSFKRDRLAERLAKLTEGVAIIAVGAPSKTEVKEKKERVIDAVHATKAALAEGIVPGGGMALKMIAAEFTKPELSESEKLVIKMLEAPFTQLMVNSGEKPADVEKLLEGKPENYGYDVVSGEVVDMFAAGVVDPVKVTKQAVLNAMSVAATILTTNVLITDLIDDGKGQGDQK